MIKNTCKCGCGKELSNHEIRYGIKFKNRKHYGVWRTNNMDKLRKKIPHKYLIIDRELGLRS
ncbi:MAG: hypothetical protein MJ244_06545 [Clostridia bacterium]|nr:hypothetical protein [Clostridia bacterium]